MFLFKLNFDGITESSYWSFHYEVLLMDSQEVELSSTSGCQEVEDSSTSGC